VSQTASTTAAARPPVSETTAYALLVLTAICWAGNHVTGRFMANAEPPVPPGALSVVRWLLAGFVLLPFALRQLRNDWPAMRADWRTLLFLGLLGGVGFSSMQYYALRYTSVVNVGLMNSVGPALIILAGLGLFRDRVRLLQLGGVAISLIGVLVIMMRGDLAVISTLAFNSGDVIAFINMAIFAVYSACLRMRPAIGGLSFLLIFSFISAIGSLPIALVEFGLGERLAPSWPAVLSILYTALFTSLVAYLAWNTGVARLGAQRAAAFLHLVPLFGALMAILLFGEQPRLFHAVGLAMIVAGVTIAARKPTG